MSLLFDKANEIRKQFDKWLKDHCESSIPIVQIITTTPFSDTSREMDIQILVGQTEVFNYDENSTGELTFDWCLRKYEKEIRDLASPFMDEKGCWINTVDENWQDKESE